MLIRPQLQFFKDGIKIMPTDTNYYQKEIKVTISIKEVYKMLNIKQFFSDFCKNILIIITNKCLIAFLKEKGEEELTMSVFKVL